MKTMISTLKRALNRKGAVASEVLGQGSHEHQYSLNLEEKKPMISLKLVLKNLLIASGISFAFAGTVFAAGYPTVDLNAAAKIIQDGVNNNNLTEDSSLANSVPALSHLKTCIYKNTVYSLGAVVKMVGKDLYVCSKGQTVYVNAKKITNNINAVPKWIRQSKETLYFNDQGDYDYFLKNGITVAQAAIKFKGIDDNGTVSKPS